MNRNRLAFNADTRDTGRRKYFSPTSFAQFEITLKVALENARGDLLDVGAGDIPYREMFRDVVTSYQTVDFERRVSGIDFVVSAEDMSDVILSDTYDTVLLFEVLEHVTNPCKVATEIHRVLREGGTMIASVPHLSRLHEEPFDFYRYTKYGLMHIFESAGFERIEIIPRGGIFSFVGHQASTAIICLTWHIPLIRQIAYQINKWLIIRPCFWLDSITDRTKLFAHGYVIVAHR